MSTKSPGGETKDSGIDSLLLQGATAAITGAIGQPESGNDGAVDEEFSKFIHHTLGSTIEEPVTSKNAIGLHNINDHIENLLVECTKKNATTEPTSPESTVTENKSDTSGRIGPEKVVFESEIGAFIVDEAKLVLASQSNFSSARANVCVYKGKWVYELMLGSKGVMQIGFCTHKCVFHEEIGVGDTEDSYSYDGNRIRKWNIATSKYGDEWQTGDVVSCMIDADNGIISFARNGKNLGVAYDNVKLGQGYAYFPAISLSFNENIQANFGATPLRYPLFSYQPVQNPPTDAIMKANFLVDCLERSLPSLVESKTSPSMKLMSDQAKKNHVNKLLVCTHLFEKLTPLLSVAYIVDDIFIKFLLRLIDNQDRLGVQPLVAKMLDLMWICMESHEIKKCLELFAVILTTKYRYSPTSTEMKFQIMYLTLALAVLRHEKTRKHLLKHVLFSRVRFAYMMLTKPPDDAVLAELLPTPWWRTDGLQPAIVQCPLPVTLCFFHRLIVALRYYWDKYAEENPMTAVKSKDAFVPPHMFYANILDYFTLSRVGGSVSSLDEELKDDLEKVDIKKNSSEFKGEGFSSVKVKEETDQCSKKREQPSSVSLLEILDGIIMLYDIGVHKQLGKMAAIYDNAAEFATALKETQRKLKKCGNQNAEVYNDIMHSNSVFEKKTLEHARHVAWVATLVFSKDKQDNVVFVLKAVLKSISAAHTTGSLFGYVPEFYLDTCINAYNGIRNYFSLAHQLKSIQGIQELMVNYGVFLSRHFADKRIKRFEIKDTVIQAMMWYVANKETLTLLESMPRPDRVAMVRSLLSPYESRTWAQTNWILVRLWKGNGFAFRYVKPPHILSPKPSDKEKEGTILQTPCPSPIFQEIVREVLLEDDKFTTNFLNSVLNQLNWSFSEFIGMLQEISHISSKNEPHILDPQQLKLCGTCFDLTVGLTRVLEFITAKAHEVFLDWSRTSAELILCRLYQLITHVLNRVIAPCNIFENVVKVDLPGMDGVDKFPILASVAGILTNLICIDNQKFKDCAIKTLLADSGFQMNTLEFLMSGEGPRAATVRGQRRFDSNFSFKKYEEVNEEEVKKVEDMIESVQSQYKIAPPPPQTPADEEVCTICYARPQVKIFQPCGHKSCSSCVEQHLMNDKNCFFCKTEIKKVKDIPLKLFL
uniref:E3 ubiquitin-protein ligase RNF123-like n=1 Tax=Saccoglossus kowalevskii TaxID=10224 RepID=A0ABM0MR51_SACKO|nr:PREDICTED: E3 ubiquitin-protein ligase RNF123-like [Saccoglossus kowalevskii]